MKLCCQCIGWSSTTRTEHVVISIRCLPHFYKERTPIAAGIGGCSPGLIASTFLHGFVSDRSETSLSLRCCWEDWAQVQLAFIWQSAASKVTSAAF